MSIPLDRLYHYIKDIAQEVFDDHVIIYRFFPHGSKKIEDLTMSTFIDVYQLQISPEIFCNDQEPLNYKLYQGTACPTKVHPSVRDILKRHSVNLPQFNFRGSIQGIWDHALLLHSEKRSNQVMLYQNTQFIPVYYWSHAVIARDWFRYAEHISQRKQVAKTFLIYNRAWAGTREYRLRFAELLVRLGLQHSCLTTVNPVEPELGVHYELHNFDNVAWRPKIVLENYFPSNTAHSNCSADFNFKDYEATDIEVVLETLFDDTRLHLTEKIIRPIACGQPFILVATHGSLEYLRSYGFKTFGDVWDETYDTIEDPQLRLCAIADLMKRINNWGSVRESKMAKAREIANYNKEKFFSDDFTNQIKAELKTNFSTAFDQLKQLNTAQYYFDREKLYQSMPEFQEHRDSYLSKSQQQQITTLAKKYQK